MEDKPTHMKVSGNHVEIHGLYIDLTGIERSDYYPAVAHEMRLRTNEVEFWEMIKGAADKLKVDTGQGVFKEGFAKIAKDIEDLIKARENLESALRSSGIFE
jgi:hypothetical protein